LTDGDRPVTVQGLQNGECGMALAGSKVQR